MMSLTFGLFNQVSGLGPLGPLVSTTAHSERKEHSFGVGGGELFPLKVYLFLERVSTSRETGRKSKNCFTFKNWKKT